MPPGDSRLLELIGDTSELLEIEEFRSALLEAVRRAVPSDWVTLNDIGPDPDTIAVLVDPVPDPAMLREFATLAHQNPLIEHYNLTHDARAWRISDIVSQEEFHSREVYQRIYRLLKVEYQLAFTLPHVKDRILGVALSRSDRDFSEQERDMLETARPFLIQSYRNAVRYSALLAGRRTGQDPLTLPDVTQLCALGLTHRQSQVLQLIATGAAEREIGVRLGISHRTVQKHLEHCYRTLGVDSRSRAAAIAWATIDAAF